MFRHADVCVLCSSCGSSQYCVLHDLLFGNAGLGCKRRPYGRDILQAPNKTGYIRWSCHMGLANPVQIVSTPPAPSNGCPIKKFWGSQPCGPAGWLAMLLIKAGDVETDPGPTTTRKQVWICDVCHKQIQVRKQISIRCNRIEHWVT